MTKRSKVAILLLLALAALLAAAYCAKSMLGIDILKDRHLLFFKEERSIDRGGMT